MATRMNCGVMAGYDLEQRVSLAKVAANVISHNRAGVIRRAAIGAALGLLPLDTRVDPVPSAADVGRHGLFACSCRPFFDRRPSPSCKELTS
jgi:hypothetical protein